MNETVALPEVISFGDPAVQRCRFAAYDALRDKAPVYRDPQTQIYMILDHELARTYLRDTETLSSEAGQVLVMDRPYQAKIDKLVEEHGGHKPFPVLSFADAPNHTYQRALIEQVLQAFQHKRVKEMEGYIDEVSNKAIDEFIGAGEADFFEQLANVVPCMIICDQIGLPRENAPTFKKWFVAYLKQADQGLTEEQDTEIALILAEMQKYLAEKIQEYRANPARCMLSDLATLEVEGRKLEVRELVSMATILLIAGIGTTRSTMCSSIYRIATTPGLEEELRDHPERIPPFIEEVLRLESPVNNVYRRATRDVEIGGVLIPANSVVAISIGAANRDPDTFSCPADLSIDRRNLTRHLAFGHGPHLCLGKELGRAEVRITLENLLSRMKNIRLASGEGSVERSLHFFQHSILKLPIAFDRAA